MYIFYILIILIIIILFILVKDKSKLIRKIGIASLVSSLLLNLIGFLLTFLFYLFLNNINITRIARSIFIKFIYNSLFFFVLGIIGIIISKFIDIRKKNTVK